jgi:hypothetical protein
MRGLSEYKLKKVATMSAGHHDQLKLMVGAGELFLHRARSSSVTRWPRAALGTLRASALLAVEPVRRAHRRRTASRRRLTIGNICSPYVLSLLKVDRS